MDIPGFPIIKDASLHWSSLDHMPKNQSAKGVKRYRERGVVLPIWSTGTAPPFDWYTEIND